jgi:hypothetical protein
VVRRQASACSDCQRTGDAMVLLRMIDADHNLVLEIVNSDERFSESASRSAPGFRRSHPTNFAMAFRSPSDKNQWSPVSVSSEVLPRILRLSSPKAQGPRLSRSWRSRRQAVKKDLFPRNRRLRACRRPRGTRGPVAPLRAEDANNFLPARRAAKVARCLEGFN